MWHASDIGHSMVMNHWSLWEKMWLSMTTKYRKMLLCLNNVWLKERTVLFCHCEQFKGLVVGCQWQIQNLTVYRCQLATKAQYLK